MVAHSQLLALVHVPLLRTRDFLDKLKLQDFPAKEKLMASRGVISEASPECKIAKWLTDIDTRPYPKALITHISLAR